MSRIHCPECGFQNLEAASYCAKCGAYLLYDDPGQVTMSFTPGRDDDAGLAAGEVPADGRAILVRLGGRAIETFTVTAARVTIGRSPDCDIFLDDVTVSRLHAVLECGGDGCRLADNESLNGTFLNRRRVEEARLRDADEVQIGKYRLTFIDR